VKQIGKAAWWAGPWLGLAFFAWRQAGLEARLSVWVQATNDAVTAGIGRLADAATEAVGESEVGRVNDR
jgi:coproporphyrinogen III oxidase-like Fe-S oxidoreductase